MIWDGIISIDRRGEKPLSGMKQLCEWKSEKTAAVLSERTVMGIYLVYSSVSAMTVWDDGKKLFPITKWQQYSSRRTGLWPIIERILQMYPKHKKWHCLFAAVPF